jgi:PilZ domain/SPOR domain
MPRPERRQLPRMTVNGPAYVNLDPNNGGVILNISEGGLCFQSTAPIQRTETIRFWFSYRHPIQGFTSGADAPTKGVSRFIEVGSELAWTDHTRKTGGLRFTNLPADSREQIRNWIRQSSLVAVNGKAALAPPKSRFSAAQQSTSNAAWRAYAGLAALFQHIRSQKRWTGFSGGVLAGVLVSALVVAVSSFLTHSHALGDTFIRLGERLGGRSLSEPISPQPQPQANAQQPRSLLPEPVEPEFSTIRPEPRTVTAASIRTPLQEKIISTAAQVPTPTTTIAATPVANKSSAVKLEAASPTTPPPSAPNFKPSDTPSFTSTTAQPPPPGIGFTPSSDPGTSLLRSTASEMAWASRPALHVEPSKTDGIVMRSEKYLEVGKVKEKLLADKTIDKLSQLGFPATVIQRSRLWGKYYQVLAGPYAGDREAEAAHKDLTSLGFTPRSYERGKRDFTLPPALKLVSTRLPVGECVISWESYTPDAIVKIEGRDIAVTVEGKWVKRGAKYTQDAIGYQKNRDGSRTLIEIHFAGMTQTLVFASN